MTVTMSVTHLAANMDLDSVIAPEAPDGPFFGPQWWALRKILRTMLCSQYQKQCVSTKNLHLCLTSFRQVQGLEKNQRGPTKITTKTGHGSHTPDAAASSLQGLGTMAGLVYISCFPLAVPLKLCYRLFLPGMV